MSSGSDYPITNLKFEVWIGDLQCAEFSEVTGLSVEIETEDYHEGGVNDYIHKLPKALKYQNIVLKKGIIQKGEEMWDWIQEVMEASITRKECTIVLLNDDDSIAYLWEIKEAYPVKWSGSDLKATGGEIFLETLELTHRGIKKI
ncbi:MAG: phage tail protein [bacterium]|nr:phage tail protein [bacterium]